MADVVETMNMASVRGAKLKCCNCEREHSSAYRGCEVSKKAEEVQQVRVAQGIVYAEAVKKVSANIKEVTRQIGNKNHSCRKM